ncbi:MAG: hypothetical protein HY875_00210 [Chloroflexi bacterium]|nr:hypothetical protein [Chloroflexota bacterium]
MSARVELADPILEELTARLVDMTGEEPTCDAVYVYTRGAWSAEIAGEASWLTAVLSRGEGRDGPPLDDFQLAIIYGLGFEKDEEGSEPGFLQEWELEEGDSWEEDALRELALQTLALLSRVLDCGPIVEMKVDVSPL